MSYEIKRRTENYICQKLTIAVSGIGGAAPGHRFYPFNGGSETQLPADSLEPPFTVVEISEAEKQFSQESTWLAKGTIQVIHHIAEATGQDHARIVKAIYDAIIALQPTIPGSDFSFHGIDVGTVTNGEDTENSVYADVIGIVCGVGG